MIKQLNFVIRLNLFLLICFCIQFLGCISIMLNLVFGYFARVYPVILALMGFAVISNIILYSDLKDLRFSVAIGVVLILIAFLEIMGIGPLIRI